MNLGLARTLLLDVPRQARLAYCLLRDERIPAAPKAALLGSLALIASPLDVPAWIPVVGELDMLALGVLAVKVFVDACPASIVAEHREAIARKDSRFHRDTRTAVAQARSGAERMYAVAARRVAARGQSWPRPRAGARGEAAAGGSLPAG